MAKKSQKLNVGLMLHTRTDNSYGHFFHIDLYPVSIQDGAIRNFSFSRFDSPVNGIPTLADLYIESQGDGDSRKGGRGLYAWEVRFKDVHSIDASRADAMAKTLKKIDAKLTAANQKFGYPASYSEFVVRVANALGATCIVETKRSGSFYKDGEYAFHGLDYGRRWIAKLEQDWLDEIKPKESVDSVTTS